MACTRWASSAGACTSTFFGEAAPEIGEIAEHEQRAKVGRKSTENSALFESTFSDNSYGAGGGGVLLASPVRYARRLRNQLHRGAQHEILQPRDYAAVTVSPQIETNSER